MYFGQAAEYQQKSGLPVEYDRKIRYLDYMENGERSRGAGFVKFERRGKRCNISIQVSGLYRKDHFTRPLLLMAEGGERELSKLQMANGGVKTYLEDLDCGNMDGQGLAYEDITGLRIPISEGKEILCLWGTHAGAHAEVQAEAHVEVQANRAESVAAEREALQSENIKSELPQNENVRRASPQDEDMQDGVARDESMRSEPVQSQPTWNENIQTRFIRDEYARAEGAQSMPVHNGRVQNTERRGSSGLKPETPMPEIQILDIQKPESRKQSASRGQDTSVPFKEEKWEQLWSIYPHIHPFSDEREYLSFGLSDLVVLPARYYRLVNNSFLLHGFYNFHHLILTRLNGRNGARYFIGVPGNLYQTEKDTAIMFGFENFECDREPAGKGDFGYYLIQVEL